jgi:DNA-binding MarR family transcriptional regulator
MTGTPSGPGDEGAIPVSSLRAADALRRGLTRLYRRLRRVRADHGVSPSKLSVLGRLHRAGGPLTAVELSRLERLQPQSLTRIIAELETAGLVARRQDQNDRRAVLITITDAGSELLAMDARQQNAWLARAVEARLTDTEAALLAMAANLLDRLAEDPDSAA